MRSELPHTSHLFPHPLASENTQLWTLHSLVAGDNTAILFAQDCVWASWLTITQACQCDDNEKLWQLLFKLITESRLNCISNCKEMNLWAGSAKVFPVLQAFHHSNTDQMQSLKVLMCACYSPWCQNQLDLQGKEEEWLQGQTWPVRHLLVEHVGWIIFWWKMRPHLQQQGKICGPYRQATNDRFIKWYFHFTQHYRTQGYMVSNIWNTNNGVKTWVMGGSANTIWGLSMNLKMPIGGVP